MTMTAAPRECLAKQMCPRPRGSRGRGHMHRTGVTSYPVMKSFVVSDPVIPVTSTT
jgi:hypothetical protein